MNKFKQYEAYGNKVYLMYFVYALLICPVGLVYFITNIIAPVSPISFAELEHLSAGG